MPDFADKVALITGAASGIGLATARHLANRGARLILVDRDAGPEVDHATWHHGDVAEEAFWNALDLAGLDMAVVNAGISATGTISDLAFADWRRVMAVNLDGAFLTLRAAMRAMAGRSGAIVVTASATGVKAEPGIAAYATSKAALIHLAKVAAKEGARQRLRVNAIAPGGVETAIWRGVPAFDALVARDGEAAAFATMATHATPLGRFATPEEVAGQIAFLLSDAAATITGAVLVSDGGYVL